MPTRFAATARINLSPAEGVHEAPSPRRWKQPCEVRFLSDRHLLVPIPGGDAALGASIVLDVELWRTRERRIMVRVAGKITRRHDDTEYLVEASPRPHLYVRPLIAKMASKPKVLAATT